MAKPLVAIVGRPNVGKSMLFNKLTGQRTSIVEDTPGVTRDRIYGDCEWCGRSFALVDTGGIEPGTENDMLKFMRRQAEIGIELADAIVMVTHDLQNALHYGSTILHAGHRQWFCGSTEEYLASPSGKRFGGERK